MKNPYDKIFQEYQKIFELIGYRCVSDDDTQVQYSNGVVTLAISLERYDDPPALCSLITASRNRYAIHILEEIFDEQVALVDKAALVRLSDEFKSCPVDEGEARIVIASRILKYQIESVIRFLKKYQTKLEHLDDYKMIYDERSRAHLKELGIII